MNYYQLRTRVLWHIAFWLAFVLYYVLIIGSFEGESYGEVFIYRLLDLPVKILATYFVLYFLIPEFFFKKRIILFSSLFFLSMFVAGALQKLYHFYFYNPFLRPDLPNELSFQPFEVLKLVLGIYPIVGLAAFIKVGKNWLEKDRASQRLEKEKIQAELNFLKSQIHPHFLFNTLNNLYALTLRKSDKASEVVLKLSHLLNYLLYEGNKQQVALEKELEIITTYITLEKLRYGERLDVSFTVKGSAKAKEVSPMLLLPFVENSFKHGASQQLDQVWVRIEVLIQEKSLVVKVVNSKSAAPSAQAAGDVPKGIGLKNVQRRLDLLFGNNYTLKIQEEESSFQVNMEIPIILVSAKPNASYHEAKLLHR
ncbi:sensor histidine kinase [Nafulsella turpanensis]|uniref:sensor histidine kinase n=1 Tax=Nafulsella turpanensis TaxID=1265690 RepID=UPI000345DE7F|nr:histidine kinase [Nafulsella turpanensis]